jgi:hypothetical protein
VAILDLGGAGFRKEPSSSGPQTTKNISGKSEQVFKTWNKSDQF